MTGGAAAIITKIDSKNNNGNYKNKKNRTINLTITAGSFYSDAEHIHSILKAEASRLNVKPVIKIDPNSIIVNKPKLTESQKAFMLARKYMKEDPSNTLRTIWQHNRNRQMSKANIKFVNDIVAKIKAKITEGLP